MFQSFASASSTVRPSAEAISARCSNDLRDSGAIEQDADVVIGLHREGYYDQESSDPYLAEAIVLKNRKGQTGTVYLQWLPEFTSFGNRSAKTDDDY